MQLEMFPCWSRWGPELVYLLLAITLLAFAPVFAATLYNSAIIQCKTKHNLLFLIILDIIIA